MSKKKSKKKQQHPTLFVLEGTIRCYRDGSMLELHGLITELEWQQIIEDTVKYKVFVECLKNVAMPLLKENWEEEDDWFRLQLEVAVSRMRNIDPLLVAKYDQEKIAEALTKQMQKGVEELDKMVIELREAQRMAKSDDESVNVSDL